MDALCDLHEGYISRRRPDGERHLRALFVSGYSNEVISHRGVLGEGIELLTKPFTENELLGKVRSVLDQESVQGRTNDSYSSRVG